MSGCLVCGIGISLDRLINGTVYATQAFLPREGGCQDPGYNAWEIVSMRERFLKIADIDDTGGNAESRKQYIVVIVRSDYKFTNNKSDYRRWWPEKDLLIMIEELKKSFPAHEVKIFSDKDEVLMNCIKCHIELFYHADIVIGHHGAGLMNTLYQRAGGIVVEVLPYFDSRHAPLTGIFSRVSGKKTRNSRQFLFLSTLIYMFAGTIFLLSIISDRVMHDMAYALYFPRIKHNRQ